MKKILIIILSSVIAFSPLLASGSFSYAESGGGAWDPITDEETLVAAFKAYCQRRNFDISHEPNTLKDIVKWDYSQIEKLCALAGTTPETLNAHIWYAYDKNGLLKFFFDNTALSILNGFYGSIINENNMSANTEKTVYSGKVFTDGADNRIYCFVTVSSSTQMYDSQIIAIGDKYIYTGAELKEYLGTTVFFPVTANNPITTTVTRGEEFGTYVFRFGLTNATESYFYRENGGSLQYQFVNGYPCIINYSDRYWFGVYHEGSYIQAGSRKYERATFKIQQINNPNAQNSTIKYNQGDEAEPLPEDKSMEIQTADTTINNYITNNDSHDTYNYYDDDDPPEPNKPVPLPSTPDYPTGGSVGSDGSFNWTMPDINIQWQLPDFELGNLPFPFSIPYDIIQFLEVMDSDPVAPHYEIHTTIYNTPVDVDIDLSFFDDWMGIFRGLVLTGYCIFLIVSTRALFHIY